MSTSTQPVKKNVDASPDPDGLWRCERLYFAVPADWIRIGKHEAVLEDRERFVAEHVCYEYRVERQRDLKGGFTEKHELYIRYRKPGSDEAVERSYRASVLEDDREKLPVPTDQHEGDLGPNNWGRVAYSALKPTDNLAVVPRVVRNGRPLNFRASVAVHESERRVRGGE